MVAFLIVLVEWLKGQIRDTDMILLGKTYNMFEIVGHKSVTDGISLQEIHYVRNILQEMQYIVQD